MLKKIAKKILGRGRATKTVRDGRNKLVKPDRTQFQFIREVLERLEADPAVSTRDDALVGLRELGLGDFGAVLWASPISDYPKLAKLLPRMSSVEVQREWTGDSGERLLFQSLSFVRSVSENYTAITGQTLAGRAILDYGCGYARFLRLFSYYTQDLWGVDAWEASLEESRWAGFADRVKKIDPKPESLPFEKTFDLVFAFSIFTHLHSDTAQGALAAIAKSVRPGGVACITIRPPEYWLQRFERMEGHSAKNAASYVAGHANKGYAFRPHPGRKEDADTYGDSSMSLDWLRQHAEGWEVVAVDGSPIDYMQRYVFLKRV